jgi:3D (Asp-Asp-Asp) domain-containing protein
MLLTRSLKQKIAATCGAMFGFVLLYEVTMLDSKTTEARTIEIRETTAKPAPGLRLRFTSTAYCKGTTTASGAAVRSGIAAADPDLLPVGSVIQVYRLGERYNGIYTIMDTGPAVQGRELEERRLLRAESGRRRARRRGRRRRRRRWPPSRARVA